jgi:hypothetical protein
LRVTDHIPIQINIVQIFSEGIKYQRPNGS